MKWITREEIRKEAMKSEHAALICTIEHWKQIYKASWKHLRHAMDDKLVGCTVEYCALCQRNKVHSCPLDRDCNGNTCVDEWVHAHNAVGEKQDGIDVRASNREIKKFITFLESYV